MNSLFEERRQGDPIRVDCTSLDGIFAAYQLDKCDLLKIDCEGDEYEILLGASPDVLNRIGTVILEWHDIPGHSPERLEQHLEKAGFSTYRPRRRIIVGARREHG